MRGERLESSPLGDAGLDFRFPVSHACVPIRPSFWPRGQELTPPPNPLCPASLPQRGRSSVLPLLCCVLSGALFVDLPACFGSLNLGLPTHPKNRSKVSQD